MIEVKWDENKRLSNIAKHGFDFVRARDILLGNHIIISSKYQSDEQRYLAVGIIDGRFATIVYTMRGDAYRIISIRSARDEERRKHENLFTG